MVIMRRILDIPTRLHLMKTVSSPLISRQLTTRSCQKDWRGLGFGQYHHPDLSDRGPGRQSVQGLRDTLGEL